MRTVRKLFLFTLILGLALSQTAMAAPFEVYGRIMMGSADYIVDSDKDEHGNDRYFPSRTTFSENDAESGATALPNRVTIRADYQSNAEYLYASGREDYYREWAEKVTKVTVLNMDGDDIFYVPSMIDYTPTNDKLILNTADLQSGMYTARIYAEGYTTFVFNLELVRPAPKLNVSGNSFPIYANEETIFTLDSSFGFAWENPIYAVLLNGVPLSAEQYTATFDTIRIHEGVLTQAGQHTVVVKLYGYKDASNTFHVLNKGGSVISSADQAETMEVAARKSDVISSATSSSGGSDAVSSATGSVPAHLTFNFDLVANAYILRDHGLETEASKRVLEWWEYARKENMRMEGSKIFYDWEDYVNKVSQDPELTFEEYVVNGEKYKTIFWDMWETKNVLENGKLGYPYDLYEQISDAHPVIAIEYANWKDGVKLVFPENAEWRAAVKRVHVDSTELFGSEYVLNNSSITFPVSTLAQRFVNNSVVTIEASNYKTVKIKIPIGNESITYIPVLEESSYYIGDEVVIIGLPKPFTSDKVIINNEVVSGDKYTISNQKLTLDGSLFTEAGDYEVGIELGGYTAKKIVVKIRETVKEPEQPNINPYSIKAIANQQFAPLEEGYNEDEVEANKKRIVLENNGTSDLTSVRVAVYGSGFTASSLSSTTLNAGETMSFFIQPETGLAAGTHTAKVEIAAAELENSLEFEVIQVVEEAANPGGGTGDPEAPTLLNAPVGTMKKHPYTSDYVVDFTYDSTKFQWFDKLRTGAVDIYLNDAKLMENDYTGYNYSDSEHRITVAGSLFKQSGSYEITIEVEGYEPSTASIAVTVPKKNVPSNVTLKTVMLESNSQEIKMEIEKKMFDSSYSPYFSAISNVMIEGHSAAYEKVTEKEDWYDMFYLVIKKEELPNSSGVYTIKIQAAGYNDYTVTLTVQ